MGPLREDSLEDKASTALTVGDHSIGRQATMKPDVISSTTHNITPELAHVISGSFIESTSMVLKMEHMPNAINMLNRRTVFRKDLPGKRASPSRLQRATLVNLSICTLYRIAVGMIAHRKSVKVQMTAKVRPSFLLMDSILTSIGKEDPRFRFHANATARLRRIPQFVKWYTLYD